MAVPATMKAWQYNKVPSGIENALTLNESAPVPSLNAGESLVKVHAASLNPVDYKLPEMPFPGSLAVKRPGVIGHDVAGTLISTTNPSLKPLEGKRVIGTVQAPAHHGTCAEYCVIKGSENIVALPDTLSTSDASTIPICGLTAYQSIISSLGPEAEVKGARIFINGGSGGTGVFGVQLAKALGAAHVTASCSTKNVELLASLGADRVIDYRNKDISQALVSEVGDDLEGKGYDLAVDNVGKPLDLYKAANRYLKPAAQFVQIGATPSLADMRMMGERALRPSWLGGGERKWRFLGAQTLGSQLERIAELMADGKIKAVVGETFAFDQVPEAYRTLKKGTGVGGKVVVKVVED